MSRKLKPCPFCGEGNVKTFGPYGWHRQWGISHSCKSFYTGTSEIFKDFSTEVAAAEAWNSRAAASASEAAWPIDTDDQVEALARECDWDNRKYMSPKDYAIWCERMRKFARLALLSASPSPVDSRELIERLVKALKPFAQAASVLRTVERTTGREFKDEDAFQSGLAWNNDGIVTTITYGHLRAARVALAAKEQQP